MDFQSLWNTFVGHCVSIAWRLLAALLVLLIGNVIIKIVIKLFKRSRGAKKIDPTVKGFVESFIKIGLYALLATMLVAILGVETASIIAVFAAAGAAIALALQGSLSNLAGGIMLLIFKPFSSGNYIEAESVSGTVLEIGIFYTTLRTPDNKHITIPNGTLLNTVITNYSVEKTRRVEIEWRIDLSEDPERVKEIIQSVVDGHELVSRDPAPFIRMTKMDESSMVVTLRIWCESGDFWNVKFDLTESIKAELDKNGIVTPHSQIDVNIKNN